MAISKHWMDPFDMSGGTLMSFEHEVIFRKLVLCDLEQRDPGMRQWTNGLLSHPYVFLDQLNASYRRAYVTSFEHRAIFRRALLCDLKQTDPGMRQWNNGLSQSPLRVLESAQCQQLNGIFHVF